MIHFPEDVTWVINFNRIVRTGVRWCVLFSGDPLFVPVLFGCPPRFGSGKVFGFGGGVPTYRTQVHQPRFRLLK